MPALGEPCGVRSEPRSQVGEEREMGLSLRDAADPSINCCLRSAFARVHPPL